MSADLFSFADRCLTADIERERRLAASGAKGCTIHRKRLGELTNERLKTELVGVPRFTAGGWRKGLGR